MAPPRPGTRWLAAWTLAGILAAGLWGASLLAQDGRAAIPDLRAPRPISSERLRPLTGPVTLTVRDFDLTEASGRRIRVDLARVVAEPAALNGGALVVDSVIVAGLDVLMRAGSGGIDPFVEIPGPRVVIRRMRLRDAHFLSVDGRTTRRLWSADRVQLDAADVTWNGGEDRARVGRVAFNARAGSRTLTVANGAADVARTDAMLRVDGTVRAGTSILTGDARLRRHGPYSAEVRSLSLAFADVRGLLPALPESGSARLALSIAGGDGAGAIRIDEALARYRASTVDVSGTIGYGDEWSARDVNVDARLAEADMDSLAIVTLPGGGVWVGHARADGGATAGIGIEGSFVRTGVLAATGAGTPDGAAGNSGRTAEFAPAIDFDGRVRTTPAATMVGMAIKAERLPWTGGEYGGTLDLAGPLDSLDLHATVVVRATAGADTTPAGAATLDASGVLALADERRIDVRIVADTLPFTILPKPATIDSVQGHASADVRVAGPFDSLDWTGHASIRDGGFRLRSAGVVVSGLAGTIRWTGNEVVVDTIRGEAASGSVRLAGRARLNGERAVTGVLDARDVILAGPDGVRALADASVRLEGTADQPMVSGTATMHSARGGAVLAVAQGSATLRGGRRMMATIRMDSMALDAAPWPSSVADVSGSATGAIMLTGTLDSMRWDGAVRVVAGGGLIVRTGTRLSSLNGRVALEDGVATLDSLSAWATTGPIVAAGRARLAGGARTVELTVRMDSATIVDTDSATILASADLRADGPLGRPRLDGTLTVVGGSVHEDNFARDAILDPDDPPYTDMVRRVPWLRESRLRVPERAPARPPFTGTITIDVRPGTKIVDEDSEMGLTGRIRLSTDSAGVTAEGIYRIRSGFYANYGEFFEVVGGAFQFAPALEGPRVGLRSVHEIRAPLGSGLGEGSREMDGVPPLEFLGLGTASAQSQEARRLSLLPESLTQLGELLLYGVDPEPVIGYRAMPVWLPDHGGDVVDERSAAQSVALLWSYISNEAYDVVPIRIADFASGVVSVGSPYPSRIIAGPLMRAFARAGGFEVAVVQPVIGGAAPGARLAYTRDGATVSIFDEPRFRSVIAGYAIVRRRGVGLRWRLEY